MHGLYSIPSTVKYEFRDLEVVWLVGTLDFGR